jgi:hypothetical protein
MLERKTLYFLILNQVVPFGIISVDASVEGIGGGGGDDANDCCCCCCDDCCC